MRKNLKFNPKALEKARVGAGLSRAEAARKLGVTEQHIWRVEAAKCKPSADMLVQMCALYELTQEPIKILSAA